jgi:AraC-like DNA-binding protein
MSPIDIIESGVSFPRHAHAAPYAAVVLSGGYEEAGDGGRYRAEAGDVLIHAAFSAHLDRGPDRRTTVLNLPLPLLWARTSSRMRIDDADAVARLAERDSRAAVALLLESLYCGHDGLDDEADALAQALTRRDAVAVAEWSRRRDLARETVWRRFRAAYGWRRLAESAEGASDIALVEGFADQAHMTRDIRALTGRTPGQWRALQHSFKTGTD